MKTNGKSLHSESKYIESPNRIIIIHFSMQIPSSVTLGLQSTLGPYTSKPVFWRQWSMQTQINILLLLLDINCAIFLLSLRGDMSPTLSRKHHFHHSPKCLADWFWRRYHRLTDIRFIYFMFLHVNSCSDQASVMFSFRNSSSSSLRTFDFSID